MEEIKSRYSTRESFISELAFAMSNHDIQEEQYHLYGHGMTNSYVQNNEWIMSDNQIWKKDVNKYGYFKKND